MSGDARMHFMRDVLGARLVLTGAGVAAALAFAVLAGYPADMVIGTLLAGIGLVIAVVQGTYVVPLAVGLRLGWVTIGDFARAVLTAALVVVFVVAGAGLVPFLAIPALTAIALLVGTVLLVRGQVPLVPAFHPSRWWAVLRNTLALAGATALGTLYFRLTVVAMSLIATEVQTGYFATSYRVIEVLAGIPAVLVGVTFPILSRAARDDAERLRYATQRIFEIALVGGVWMTLTTVLGAGLAIAVVGGEEAAPAAEVLRIQALYLVPVFLNLTWQTTLLALRMHREMMISAAVALAVVAILAFSLIPSLEARGAAIAVVVGEVVLMCLEAWFLWRARPELRHSFAVVPKVAVAALASVGAGLALAAGDLVVVAVATAIYFAVLAVLRGIPSELFGALAGRQ
jgi:O-antigen/teichoic acid export membrane protein